MENKPDWYYPAKGIADDIDKEILKRFMGMEVLKYRKKPVVIEAMLFVYSKEGITALRKWAGKSIGQVTKYRHPSAKAEMEICTLEDGVDRKVVHIATEGDYIIKGIQGEFYPCKENIFNMTYEEVI